VLYYEEFEKNFDVGCSFELGACVLFCTSSFLFDLIVLLINVHIVRSIGDNYEDIG